MSAWPERLGSLWVEERYGGRLLPLHGTAALPLPPHVREAAVAALGEHERLPPARGLPELRAAIGALHGRDPDTEVLVTAGAQHALSLAFRALLEPGDEVLVPSPAYFFGGPITAAGGRPVYVPGRAADGWRWDLDALERAVGPRARVLVACNPGNPTGHLPGEEEVAALVSLAARHGLALLTDEAYERYVYDGARLASVSAHAPDAALVRSLGKSFAMPSWRLGYLVAPREIVTRALHALEVDCIRMPYAGQRVALAALTGPQDWLAGIAAEYERNRDAALAAVEDAGLAAVRPAAAPFLLVDLHGAGEGELLEHGVPAVPGRFFGAEGYARVPFGGDVDALAGALRAFSQSRSSSRT